MSDSSMSSWLTPSYSALEYLRRAFNHRAPVGRTLLATAGAYIVLYVAADAWKYFVLTPMNARGRFSHTPHFYVISGLVRLYRNIMGLDGKRTTAIRAFVAKTTKQPYKQQFLKSGELAIRRGPRPDTVRNGIPQRQIPQMDDPEIRLATAAILASYVDQHPAEIFASPSVVEAGGPALFLKKSYISSNPDIGTGVAWSGNNPNGHEFLHVHENENSIHMVLAPLDAAEAIEKGWAIRFPAAGCGMPQGFVMVYSSRDMGEVEVVRTLVGASVAWMISQNV